VSVARKPVDVVIVGFGWTGAIMAAEMCKAGLSVLALERGENRETVPDFAYPKVNDEIAQSARNGLLQNLGATTVTLRHDKSQTAVPYRQFGSFKPGEGVGGAGVHWSGVHSRITEAELNIPKHYGERYGKKIFSPDMTPHDWGVTYDDLEPHFDRFEYVIGTSSYAYNIKGQKTGRGNVFEPWRSREFPLPPQRDHPTGQIFAKAVTELGFHPYALPSANMSQAYTNSYGCQLAPCNYCGFCSDYGCLNYSKASPQTCIMPFLGRMKNFELRAKSHVLRVNKSADGKTATGVTYVDAQGQEIEQPASIVVLAAFHLHNVRLMLTSGIGVPYNPDTGEGVVGRNFAYQLLSSVNLFFDKDVWINQFIGAGGCGQAIDDFNSDNFDHGPHKFIGGGVIWGRQTGNGPVRGIPLPKGSPKWGSEWKKLAVDNWAHTGRIEAQCSNMPYRQCFMDLDPTYRDAYGTPLLRMTLNWQDNDLRMSQYVAGQLDAIGKAMGAKSQSGRVLKPGAIWDTREYQSTHINGGTSMGTDPRTSAVNRYLQSWDVSNVFVLGANVFANGIGYNPTGVVGALAYWCAENIQTRYLKSPGPMA
jgi:gluconate 2-dehydrogenase alpha chain